MNIIFNFNFILLDRFTIDPVRGIQMALWDDPGDQDGDRPILHPPSSISPVYLGLEPDQIPDESRQRQLGASSCPPSSVCLTPPPHTPTTPPVLQARAGNCMLVPCLLSIRTHTMSPSPVCLDLEPGQSTNVPSHQPRLGRISHLTTASSTPVPVETEVPVSLQLKTSVW